MSDRTFASEYHEPVMVEQVLDYLAVRSGGVYVDGTLGGGGHSQAILEASAPDGQLVGIDRDPEALEAARERLEAYSERASLRRGNYSDAARICEELEFLPVDGFLVDAGVSSRQLDASERGFSWREPGPLDMRMGPEAPRLDDWLAKVDHRKLREVLRDYGELRSAGRIAAAILEAREAGRLETTTDLTEAVQTVVGSGPRKGVNPVTLVFQGLRIELNQELRHLERAVEQVPELVASGGRAVFISFHSLEDRIVKHGFRDLARECVCPPDLPICGCDAEARVEVLTKGPVRPTEEEVERNPRARSALLRAVEVL